MRPQDMKRVRMLAAHNQLDFFPRRSGVVSCDLLCRHAKYCRRFDVRQSCAPPNCPAGLDFAA